jgi:DNA-binding CsgD family transcriptional regulator
MLSPSVYCEEEVQASDQPVSCDARHAILHELHRARSAAARKAIVRAQLDQLGLDHMEYHLLGTDDRNTVTGYFASYVPEQWADLYLRARLYAVDPRLTLTSSLPIRWSLDELDVQFADAAIDPARRRLLQALADAGMRSGLCCVVDSTTPGDMGRGVFVFSAREPHFQWITDAIIGRAFVLALSVHEFFTRSMPSTGRAIAGETLTARQVQILRCLAEGKRDKEIAGILSLSKHTVDYHLRMLKRRFTARTRTQLVSATSRLVSDTLQLHSINR